MKRVLMLLEITTPLLLSICMSVLLIRFGFDPGVKRFEKVLDGSITFSSILVGFLSALMGIMMSIRSSDVVKGMFEVRNKKLLVYYLSETIFLGFAVVISSGLMYTFIESCGYHLPFYSWIVVTFWFLPSSIRVVLMMLLILFKSDVTLSRPQGNNMDPEERERARRENSKEKILNNN